MSKSRQKAWTFKPFKTHHFNNSSNDVMNDLCNFQNILLILYYNITSVIRQKGESQNGCFNCVSGGKKCSFFGKFDVLCFPETPFSRFTLLPYYRRITQ